MNSVTLDQAKPAPGKITGGDYGASGGAGSFFSTGMRKSSR